MRSVCFNGFLSMPPTRALLVRTLPLVVLIVLTAPRLMAQQPPVPAPPAAAEAAPGAEPAAHEQAGSHEAAGEGAHEAGLLPTVARVVNFAILAGVLVYFLRTPIKDYLATRSGEIRQDLVTAREMRATATAQLAEIEQQLKALPGELEALKARGAADLGAERERLAQAAADERQRLLEHAHREVAMKLRLARRDLVEQTATLAVDVARARIATTMTTDDQLRLVDRYAGQLEEAR